MLALILAAQLLLPKHHPKETPSPPQGPPVSAAPIAPSKATVALIKAIDDNLAAAHQGDFSHAPDLLNALAVDAGPMPAEEAAKKAAALAFVEQVFAEPSKYYTNGGKVGVEKAVDLALGSTAINTDVHLVTYGAGLKDEAGRLSQAEADFEAALKGQDFPAAERALTVIQGPLKVRPTGLAEKYDQRLRAARAPGPRVWTELAEAGATLWFVFWRYGVYFCLSVLLLIFLGYLRRWLTYVRTSAEYSFVDSTGPQPSSQAVPVLLEVFRSALQVQAVFQNDHFRQERDIGDAFPQWRPELASEVARMGDLIDSSQTVSVGVFKVSIKGLWAMLVELAFPKRYSWAGVLTRAGSKLTLTLQGWDKAAAEPVPDAPRFTTTVATTDTNASEAIADVMKQAAAYVLGRRLAWRMGTNKTAIAFYLKALLLMEDADGNIDETLLLKKARAELYSAVAFDPLLTPALLALATVERQLGNPSIAGGYLDRLENIIGPSNSSNPLRHQIENARAFGLLLSDVSQEPNLAPLFRTLATLNFPLSSLLGVFTQWSRPHMPRLEDVQFERAVLAAQSDDYDLKLTGIDLLTLSIRTATGSSTEKSWLGVHGKVWMWKSVRARLAAEVLNRGKVDILADATNVNATDSWPEPDATQRAKLEGFINFELEGQGSPAEIARARGYQAYSRGMLALGTNPDEAEKQFLQALTYLPQLAVIYLALLTARFRMPADTPDLMRKQKEAFDRGIELSPKDQRFHEVWGRALFKAVEYDKAAEQLQLAPERPIALFTWGDILSSQSKHAEAMAKYWAAIEQWQHRAPSYAFLKVSSLAAKGDGTLAPYAKQAHDHIQQKINRLTYELQNLNKEQPAGAISPDPKTLGKKAIALRKKEIEKHLDSAKRVRTDIEAAWPAFAPKVPEAPGPERPLLAAGG